MREKVTFINLYRDNYKLYNMCDVLEISPKTYYKYRNKEDSDYYYYLIIKEVFDESKGTYGYRRVAEGIKIKYEGVVNEQKESFKNNEKHNLIPEYVRKSRKKNKNERIGDNVKPNLLNRNFNTDSPNKVLTSVILPDTFIYIGRIGFTANNLTSIEIPSSVKTVDNYAFRYMQIHTFILHEDYRRLVSMRFKVII